MTTVILCARMGGKTFSVFCYPFSSYYLSNILTKLFNIGCKVAFLSSTTFLFVVVPEKFQLQDQTAKSLSLKNRCKNHGKWAPPQKRWFLHGSNFQHKEKSSADLSEPDFFLKHSIITLIMLTHFSLKSPLQAFPERETTLFRLWDQKKAGFSLLTISLPYTSLSLQQASECICRKGRKKKQHLKSECKVTRIFFWW